MRVICNKTWIYVVGVLLKLISFRLGGLRYDLGTGKGTIARYCLIRRKYQAGDCCVCVVLQVIYDCLRIDCLECIQDDPVK
jgi:hypothetical protein